MTRTVCALVVLSSLLSAGCATQPNAKPDPRDPFEHFNRASYKFNDTLDRAVVRPIAKGYRKVTPQFIETGVSNFFSNLEQPSIIINDLLQAKFVPALSDTGRFLMNSTIGIAGLLDPASAAGLDKNDEDFGQTLGKWGIQSGPFVMLPFFGPSTVRDTFGKGGDYFTDPLRYVEEDKIRYSVAALRVVDMRAGLLDTDATLKQAYDPYAFIRNVYLQRREYLVTDGAVSPEIDEEPLEDPEATDAEPQQEAPPPDQSKPK